MPKNMNSLPKDNGENTSSQNTGWENMDVRAEDAPAEQEAEVETIESEAIEDDHNIDATSDSTGQEALHEAPTNFPLGHLTNGNNVSESSSADKPNGAGETEAETLMFEQLDSQDSDQNRTERADNSEAATMVETSFISDKPYQESAPSELVLEEEDQSYEVADEQPEADPGRKEAEEDPDKS